MDMMEKERRKKLQHPDIEWRKREREKKAHTYSRAQKERNEKKRMKIFFLKSFRGKSRRMDKQERERYIFSQRNNIRAVKRCEEKKKYT